MADFDVQVDRARNPEKGSNMSRNSDNDKKSGPKKWHIENNILCFNNWRYIPPGLLCRELLKLHYDNL